MSQKRTKYMAKDQTTTFEDVFAKADRRYKYGMAREGVIPGAVIGLITGIFLAPLFPPLIFICPALGVLIGGSGGYLSGRQIVRTKSDETLKFIGTTSRHTYMAIAGIGLGLAISVFCPPLGLFAYATQALSMGLGAGLGVAASHTLVKSNKYRYVSNGINLGTTIGAVVGFFIPLPGATAIGALIGGLLGGAITTLYCFYQKPKTVNETPKIPQTSVAIKATPHLRNSQARMLEQMGYNYENTSESHHSYTEEPSTSKSDYEPEPDLDEDQSYHQEPVTPQRYSTGHYYG